jgi:hypothetical protein
MAENILDTGTKVNSTEKEFIFPKKVKRNTENGNMESVLDGLTVDFAYNYYFNSISI